MSEGKPHLSWGKGKTAENSEGGKQATTHMLQGPRISIKKDIKFR